MKLIHKDVIDYGDSWIAFWVVDEVAEGTVDQDIFDFLEIDSNEYSGGIGQLYTQAAWIGRGKHSVLVEQSGGWDV